jgi:ribosomal protein L11 methyltransferase
VDCVPDEDWSETWKRFFHAIRVSDRIVVKPSWEPFDPAAASCVIELDPGMSFGTGQHATTQACLRMIDALCGEFPAASFLDIGCGSGILAIAAAKLGCREVTALDCDEIAVRTTRENLIRNGVATDVECRVADASNPALPRTFDIVTANILADVLVRHAAPIAATVSSRPAGGRLILAGILQSQGGAVRAAYERQGFRVLDAAHAGEWVTLLLGRQRTDTRNGYSTQTRTSCV